MDHEEEKLTQLLQSQKIENWELAWQLVQGNARLEPLFKERFKQKITSGALNTSNLAYKLAQNNEAIHSFFLQEVNQLLANTEWEQGRLGYEYDSLLFFKNAQGLLLNHMPYEYMGIDGTLVFGWYERFSYQFYFHPNHQQLCIKMTTLEGFDYRSNPKPTPFTESCSTYDDTIQLRLVNNVSNQSHLILPNFFYASDFNGGFVSHFKANTPDDIIPNITNWKTQVW